MDFLREELLNFITAFYWLLLLLRDEAQSTRELSPELKRALEKTWDAHRWANDLYEQREVLGRIPGRLREARPSEPPLENIGDGEVGSA